MKWKFNLEEGAIIMKPFSYLNSLGHLDLGNLSCDADYFGFC